MRCQLLKNMFKHILFIVKYVLHIFSHIKHVSRRLVDLSNMQAYEMWTKTYLACKQTQTMWTYFALTMCWDGHFYKSLWDIHFLQRISAQKTSSPPKHVNAHLIHSVKVKAALVTKFCWIFNLIQYLFSIFP